MIQPITVRYIQAEDIYQVITGERRLLATQSLGLAEMACWVQEPQEDKVVVQQVAENWIRSDLHPWEIADALRKLRDAYAYTQQRLATITGKPQSEIAKFLALTRIDPKVQAIAREDDSGTLTKRHLYAASKLDTPEEQRQLVQTIQEQKLTALEAEIFVADRKRRRATGGAKEGAPITRRRYITSKATVSLTFRKRHVTPSDEIIALKEVMNEIRKLD